MLHKFVTKERFTYPTHSSGERNFLPPSLTKFIKFHRTELRLSSEISSDRASKFYLRFNHSKILPPSPLSLWGNRENSSSLTRAHCPYSQKSLNSHLSAFISLGNRCSLSDHLARARYTSSQFRTSKTEYREEVNRSRRQVEAAIHFISRGRCRQPN